MQLTYVLVFAISLSSLVQASSDSSSTLPSHQHYDASSIKSTSQPFKRHKLSQLGYEFRRGNDHNSMIKQSTRSIRLRDDSDWEMVDDPSLESWEMVDRPEPTSTSQHSTNIPEHTRSKNCAFLVTGKEISLSQCKKEEGTALLVNDVCRDMDSLDKKELKHANRKKFFCFTPEPLKKNDEHTRFLFEARSKKDPNAKLFVYRSFDYVVFSAKRFSTVKWFVNYAKFAKLKIRIAEAHKEAEKKDRSLVMLPYSDPQEAKRKV
ncbi:hypothetical protein AMATHDRAFT_71678 [Amanita thiersii Skay4041]|uniref:Uncharacterized protein n=1 Tax=Amanita thiersii Skay4041 TaxID=703135 RepID=A0A2A9NCK8_9AGAR|nr:hypothetical protein AMATHDRAFT_71678 [Amanita thiersii Skay4041]